MPLPHVSVVLELGGRGKVLIDGEELPGVTSVDVHGSVDEFPQVTVTLRPHEVLADVTEGRVTVLQTGPSAAEFADKLNPARLEGLALQQMESATQEMTLAEAFAAAITLMADEFTQAHG